MSSLCLYGTGALALLAAAQADAATFRTEYSSRGFVVFSTFEKPETCQINVYFTFTHDGKRAEGETVCKSRAVPEGKDVAFCTFFHERLVDPAAASKPLLISCTPAK